MSPGRTMKPETIARKFERRDRLEAQLRALDREIAADGRAYAASKGVLFLRPERLRLEVEADLAGRAAA